MEIVIYSVMFCKYGVYGQMPRANRKCWYPFLEKEGTRVGYTGEESYKRDTRWMYVPLTCSNQVVLQNFFCK